MPAEEKCLFTTWVTYSGSVFGTSAYNSPAINCYIGPFTILKRINEVTYELQLPSQYFISPTFHVSLLKPFNNPVLPPSTETEVPPLPEVDTDDTIYQVRKVVNSSRRGGCLQYLVNWEGYGPEERSLLDWDDHQHHPNRSTPRGNGVLAILFS